MGAERIATGHYARVRAVAGMHGERYELLKGLDPAKDQSYFLHRLNQAQLSRTLFPLGDLPKSEVRRLASEIGLPNATKKDSTGICFIGERPFRQFLSRYLPMKVGPMLTPEGQRVGKHQGLSFYTLGQRKGLGIGGVKGTQQADGTAHAWYAARKDRAANALYVVQGREHPWLFSHEIRVDSPSWIAGVPVVEGDWAAKTRYRQPVAPCRLTCSDEQGFTLHFHEPQWAVTPGQSAVVYDGDVCLGGGIIA
jgi:tRNA-specific 2-thiouridylase